jgi:hypothetical protein
MLIPPALGLRSVWAMRRIHRSYWKKRPPREEWERALREEYAAERRCDDDRAAALRVRTRS